MYTPFGDQASTSANAFMGQGANSNPRMVHPQPQHRASIIDDSPQFANQYTPQNTQSQYQNTQANYANSAQSQPQAQAQYGSQFAGAAPQNGLNNLFSDPRAALGFQVGESAMMHGHQLLQNNLQPYIGSTSELKNLFKVSNAYVLKKIGLIVFPFKHNSWSRLILHTNMQATGKSESFEVPINDINSPDLYIPIMSFITYILWWAIFQGLKGEFHPELFGYTSSIVFAYQLLDFLVLKLGLYLLSVENSTWDLISYSNYKFIPLVLSMFASHQFRSSRPFVYWLLFGYFDFAFAFFLMRSLKQVFLGNGVNNTTQTVTQKQRQKRIYFLFAYSFPFQMILMWLML